MLTSWSRALRGPLSSTATRSARKRPAGSLVPDGRFMSIQLRIGDSVLHIADEFPEMDVLALPTIGGTPVVLALDVADAETVFAQAIAAGAQVRQPLADMFWGDRHGQLTDPFGHRWNISQHLRDAPHDEVVAAAARVFG
ncbi:MAG: VOC family protein [Streptosporangiaceae bacterium]